MSDEILSESGPTKKHFIQVANTVRAIQDPNERQKFADHHASIFSSQNPRFDHARWHAAAGTKTREERGIHEEVDPTHPSRKGKFAWRKKYSGKAKEPKPMSDEDREANRKSSENAVRGFQGEENQMSDETETPMTDQQYAAALAVAALEDRPADVADIFHDALQAKVAAMVEAYHEQLTQEGFGTSEPEEEPVEEGMVCKDTDDKGGGDDKDFGGDKKEKKAKKDDDSDDDDHDDDDKGKDKDEGDKKKPSFLKKEETLLEKLKGRKNLTAGSMVPKGGTKGYVPGSGDHGK